jgi:Protein of unknown function (DUF1569)
MDSRLERLREAVVSAASNLPAEQMLWHPEDKWCVAEVLEHLYLTYTGTIKGFERVMAAGKPLATPVTMKQRLQTLVVLTFNYLPEGRKAPKGTVPRGLPVETVISQLESKMDEMDQIISRCRARFGRGKVLDHPALGALSAAQWREFHLMHGMHHVKQIVKLRGQSNGTPK